MTLCVCLGAEKMWENMRKCEQQVKNVFLWYFQEYNQTSENIFRKFFWNATKYMKTFSFPKNSISEKYLFSKNAFTWTKRSLSGSTAFPFLLFCRHFFTYNLIMVEMQLRTLKTWYTYPWWSRWVNNC